MPIFDIVSTYLSIGHAAERRFRGRTCFYHNLCSNDLLKFRSVIGIASPGVSIF